MRSDRPDGVAGGTGDLPAGTGLRNASPLVASGTTARSTGWESAGPSARSDPGPEMPLMGGFMLFAEKSTEISFFASAGNAQPRVGGIHSGFPARIIPDSSARTMDRHAPDRTH
ncbi:hypothetical protein GCM10027160_09420 [Streptomyces calidiresistens]